MFLNKYFWMERTYEMQIQSSNIKSAENLKFSAQKYLQETFAIIIFAENCSYFFNSVLLN